MVDFILLTSKLFMTISRMSDRQKAKFSRELSSNETVSSLKILLLNPQTEAQLNKDLSK